MIHHVNEVQMYLSIVGLHSPWHEMPARELMYEGRFVGKSVKMNILNLAKTLHEIQEDAIS